MFASNPTRLSDFDRSEGEAENHAPIDSVSTKEMTRPFRAVNFYGERLALAIESLARTLAAPGRQSDV